VFRYCGHENVHVLDGARYRWVAEGRPLVKDLPSPRPACEYRPVTGRAEHMRILRDEVLGVFELPQTLLLDARTIEEYDGRRVGPVGGPDTGAMRYGRIPGARHLFFGDLLNADQSFKSAEELRRVTAACGVATGKNIIAYCRLSHRATVVYFVLTELLGLDNTRVYDGSWTEWGNLVGVPVER
jgi:thiosulfate/3-mercaptopyruvate sulfurtransferase